MNKEPESAAKSPKNHQFGAFALGVLADLDFVHDVQVAIYPFFVLKISLHSGHMYCPALV